MSDVRAVHIERVTNGFIVRETMDGAHNYSEGRSWVAASPTALAALVPDIFKPVQREPVRDPIADEVEPEVDEPPIRRVVDEDFAKLHRPWRPPSTGKDSVVAQEGAPGVSGAVIHEEPLELTPAMEIKPDDVTVEVVDAEPGHPIGPGSPGYEDEPVRVVTIEHEPEQDGRIEPTINPSGTPFMAGARTIKETVS